MFRQEPEVVFPAEVQFPLYYRIDRHPDVYISVSVHQFPSHAPTHHTGPLLNLFILP